jgi:hypothetical protein
MERTHLGLEARQAAIARCIDGPRLARSIGAHPAGSIARRCCCWDPARASSAGQRGRMPVSPRSAPRGPQRTVQSNGGQSSSDRCPRRAPAAADCGADNAMIPRPRQPVATPPIGLCVPAAPPRTNDATRKPRSAGSAPRAALRPEDRRSPEPAGGCQVPYIFLRRSLNRSAGERFASDPTIVRPWAKLIVTDRFAPPSAFSPASALTQSPAASGPAVLR